MERTYQERTIRRCVRILGSLDAPGRRDGSKPCARCNRRRAVHEDFCDDCLPEGLADLIAGRNPL